MLNAILRSWVIGGWIATLAIIFVVSVGIGATLSTIVLVLALGAAPAIVMMLIADGAPSPSVVQILHSIETKDGRR